MMVRNRFPIVSVVLAMLVALGAASAYGKPESSANNWLEQYVGMPDSAYGWESYGSQPNWAGGTMTDLVVTTQQWHGYTWRHRVRIYQNCPDTHPGWMLMFIDGGSGEPRPGEYDGGDALGAAISAWSQIPVAILKTVPNQPLLGDLQEDALIARTFLNYMDDGDWTWPLLLPMAKSATRALDALQEYTAQNWEDPVENFIVSGASKRGWTTWLTGAYDGGKRVKAIAPMVIDMLRIREQLTHQLEMWGYYSEEISDYTSTGLVNCFETHRGREVWRACDPFTYRMRNRMPKLLILGTNDPYWNADALNLYWEQLQGDKAVFYDPNCGHGLDYDYAVRTLAAFCRLQAAGSGLPQMTWEWVTAGDQATLTIHAPEALAARVWTNTGDTLDFRFLPWTASDVTYATDGNFTFTVTRPADKNMIAFGECLFSTGEGAAALPFNLSTQNTILRKP